MVGELPAHGKPGALPLTQHKSYHTWPSRPKRLAVASGRAGCASHSGAYNEL